MKLAWKKSPGWLKEGGYDALLPDRSYLTLVPVVEGWVLTMYNFSGRAIDALYLDAGLIRLDPQRHPIGDDPAVCTWLACHFPLQALAALAEDEHTNEETS